MNSSVSTIAPSGSPRRYSLSLHDLRVTEGVAAEENIRRVLALFSGPLTLHLVCDAPLTESPGLTAFLKNQLETGRLEIVFHGTCHACAARVWKILSWYHKNQAEYLRDSAGLKDKTLERFDDLRLALGDNAGICPPCWLASRGNWKFFETLRPSYIESLLFVKTSGKSYFSPVISLGSPNRGELRLLRLLARLFFLLSLRLPKAGARVVLHPCDLASLSMDFLLEQARRLEHRGFKPVLLKDLFRQDPEPDRKGFSQCG
jgi:hypothetical protein